VNAAAAREASLQEALKQLQGKLGDANASEIGLRRYERDAGAKRVLLESFLQNSQQLAAQVDKSFFRPTARIISEANIPDSPSFPPKRLILLLAAGAGFVVSLAIAMLIDSLQQGFRDSIDLETTINLPTLGIIPAVPSSSRKGQSLFKLLSDKANMLLAESFQAALTRIVLTRPASSSSTATTLMVTSSVAEEGKTTFSLGLARAAAFAGYRTLVVEVDFRRPAFHEMIPVKRSPGLSNHIEGTIPWRQAVHADDKLPLHFLVAGDAALSPARSLRSTRFETFLYEVSEEYDVVIFDVPPVIPVSDACIIAGRMAGIIMIVRWATTTRQRVQLAVSRIQQSGGRVLGALLSRVDTSKQSDHEYADDVYYGRKARKNYVLGG
jgi:polysaccharide biosynthesis transport protein